MSSGLGPIEIDCEAPPYPIVRECRRLGLQTPEDVRWSRLSRRPGQPPGWCALFFPHAGPAGAPRCACGQDLPPLTRYTFVMATGYQLSYRIGQCRRCRTISWEEAE
jgi:hypothetical protein